MKDIEREYSTPDIYTAPWVKLDSWVAKKRRSNPERRIWKLIESTPINEDTINKLIKAGWRVNFFCESNCQLDKKVINLERGIRGYTRDREFFHELVHAVYGEELADKTFSLFEYDNRAIAEWLGRRSRSDPALLCYTITGFQLEPYVYDRVSVLAFDPSLAGLDKQLAFYFGEERKRALCRICMDYQG